MPGFPSDDEQDRPEPQAPGLPSLVELTRNSRGLSWRVRVTVGADEAELDLALAQALDLDKRIAAATRPSFIGEEPAAA